MKVAEAARAWIKVKRQLEAIEPEFKKAGEVLKEYFRESGRNNYRGQIGYALTTYKRVDVAALRAELGEEIKKFEVRSERETLSLLKD